MIVRSHTLALLLGLFSHASAQSACTCDPDMPEGTMSTCAGKGDPHFNAFSAGKYDFMALGAYTFASTPLSACGCELTVETFMGPNVKHVGASSSVAVAMKAGTTTFVARADGSLVVSGGHSGSGAGVYGGSRVVPTTATAKGKTISGWSIGVPGGGALEIQLWPMSTMPEVRARRRRLEQRERPCQLPPSHSSSSPPPS